MSQTKPTISFEFFPPKTPEGMTKLRTTRQQLAQFQPAFSLSPLVRVVLRVMGPWLLC